MTQTLTNAMKNITCTAQTEHRAYDSALTQTHEERLLASLMPDIRAKLGIPETEGEKTAMRNGKAIRTGLLMQAGNTGAIDYVAGEACDAEWTRALNDALRQAHEQKSYLKCKLAIPDNAWFGYKLLTDAGYPKNNQRTLRAINGTAAMLTPTYGNGNAYMLMGRHNNKDYWVHSAHVEVIEVGNG